MLPKPSWRGPRAFSGLLAATLSLVYFATMIWGPETEPEAATVTSLQKYGDAKVQSAVEVEAPAPAVQRSDKPVQASHQVSQLGYKVTGLAEHELHSLEVVVVDSRNGQAINGADVRLFRAAGRGNQAPLAELQTNHSGQGLVNRLPHAQYRLQVSADGYHAVGARAIELPVDGKKHSFELEPAAQLVGFLTGLDGEALAHGVLRLEAIGNDEVVWVQPDAHGQLRSEALYEGDWLVQWLPHTRAVAGDDQLTTELTLLAGRKTSIEVVLPEGSFDPSGGRKAGIRVLR